MLFLNHNVLFLDVKIKQKLTCAYFKFMDVIHSLLLKNLKSYSCRSSVSLRAHDFGWSMWLTLDFYCLNVIGSISWQKQDKTYIMEYILDYLVSKLVSELCII